MKEEKEEVLKPSMPDYLSILEMAQYKLNGQEYKGDLIREIGVLRNRAEALQDEQARLYALSVKLGSLAEELRQLSLKGR